ncbi:hypothetical protein FACS1894151_05510 [Spirochaetia bacterium]|nr:hypothetical protein FACS1894151_05510 [Spirochaetia bacterium]
MDYAGKSVIARQAMTSKANIEVYWPAPGGGQNQALGVPEAMEKNGNEIILVLKQGAGEKLRLPLAKISLLRRIRQSIFET